MRARSRRWTPAGAGVRVAVATARGGVVSPRLPRARASATHDECVGQRVATLKRARVRLWRACERTGRGDDGQEEGQIAGKAASQAGRCR